MLLILLSTEDTATVFSGRPAGNSKPSCVTL
jgi:hypothetical protein